VVAIHPDRAMIQPMSVINQKTGSFNVYEALPEDGDTIIITNCGSHFEIKYHHWSTPPLLLTDTDIELLKQGRITWN
jgi:hypothetical protein